MIRINEENYARYYTELYNLTLVNSNDLRLKKDSSKIDEYINV